MSGGGGWGLREEAARDGKEGQQRRSKDEEHYIDRNWEAKERISQHCMRNREAKLR